MTSGGKDSIGAMFLEVSASKAPLVTRPAALRFGADDMALQNLKSRVAGLPPRVAPAPKVADRFYESREWRALAAQMKRKAGYVCARPGCGSSHRLIADHIVERKDGGADLDPLNIEVLCAEHHAQKTAAARSRRARGQ